MNEKDPRHLLPHSQNYFEQLEKYDKKLINQGLPIIYSLKHFSQLVDVNYKEMRNIIKERERHYSTFYLRKKSGGQRQIKTPRIVLKYIQKSILHNILLNIDPDDACIGFRKHYSIKDNAEVHAGQEMILRVDLYRFFDSITERRVFGLYKQLGYASNLAYDFAKLSTIPFTRYYLFEVENEDYPQNFPLTMEARLPQGAPTSPMISNLICRKMDMRFRNLADMMGIKYSRYADDLVFSGNKGKIPSIGLIDKIVSEEGFYVNLKKIRYAYRGSKQIVTGLTVTDGVHIPKKFKAETNRHLFFCNKYGVKNHLIKINFEKSAFREWLLGRIFFVKSVEPDVAEVMLKKYNEIIWDIDL